MILMHEVQGLATPALIVHRAQIVWFHLILISNVLPPKHVLSKGIRWPDNDSRQPANMYQK